jgi:hypothetical protein
MKDESQYDISDIHGQSIFNYRHPHIRDGLETELILRAFQRDFEVNGPSVVRIARTMLAGWKRYKDHTDSRVRRRFTWEARDLPTVYALRSRHRHRIRRGQAGARQLRWESGWCLVPATVAGRCSVFAKSDMIHLQQKGTPVGEIAYG